MKSTQIFPLALALAVSAFSSSQAATVFEIGTDIVGNSTTNANLTGGVNENVLRWRSGANSTELVGYISFDLVGDVDDTYTLSFDIGNAGGTGALLTDISFVGLFDGAAGEIDAANINSAFQASATAGTLIATGFGEGDRSGVRRVRHRRNHCDIESGVSLHRH